jgi:aminoglycoside phosphotransferase (APT) family kinase protein
LDVAALTRYLNAHLEELGNETRGGESAIAIEQFPGGHSNLTYLFKSGDREFVLRRPPMGPVAATAHDMAREYKLLRAIHPHFPLAPQPLLLCEDSEVIGSTFYVMERRRGVVIRNRLPTQIENDFEMRRRISEAAVDTLCVLHAIDIRSTGLIEIGKPSGFVERQVRGWAERWQRSKTSELEQMDAVIEWLAARIPKYTDEEERATLVHNDFKLDNIMLDNDDLSRVVAILDWEMCTVGDPLVDLGLFLCYWTMTDDEADGSPSLAAITTGAGWMTRDEIVDRYAFRTGRDVSRIAFYEVFAFFKVAVIVQQIFFRYARGQTSDPRFSSFDRKVARLVQTAFGRALQCGD